MHEIGPVRFVPWGLAPPADLDALMAYDAEQLWWLRGGVYVRPRCEADGFRYPADGVWVEAFGSNIRGRRAIWLPGVLDRARLGWITIFLTSCEAVIDVG